MLERQNAKTADILEHVFESSQLVVLVLAVTQLRSSAEVVEQLLIGVRLLDPL